MRCCHIFALCLIAGCSPVAAEPPKREAVAIYDANPDHLWNRLHAALFARTDRDGKPVGGDVLDPPLFPATKHLLNGPSHDAAVKALDEFLADGHALVRDPVNRAVMQRDLWAVFDWAAYPLGNFYTAGDPIKLRDGPLQTRLAKAVRKLAPANADGVPDNYALAVKSKTFPAAFDPAKPNAPFLPPDLFDPNGPWVNVAGPRTATTPVANEHARVFAGRSVFLVFVKLPGGRAATLAYLDKLNAVADPWVRKPRASDEITGQSGGPGALKPDLPQFPANTQVALVRLMVVVTDDGRPTPTPLTESVQIRTYREIRNRSKDFPEQGLVELKLNRGDLFAGKTGGLRATDMDRPVLSALTFLRSWSDPFEEERDNLHHRPLKTVEACAACHSPDGIYSVNSYTQLSQYSTARGLVPTDPAAERKRATEWKVGLKDWSQLKKAAGW
jgi:hypothetical protein